MSETRPLGPREYFALTALALGIAFALWFTFHGGDQAGGATPPVTTPVEDSALAPAAYPGESGWTISLIRRGAGGKDEVVQTSHTPTLDLSLLPPLPAGLEGREWRVEAEETFTGSPGQYEVDLRYRGRLTADVDGRRLAAGNAPAQPNTMHDEFQQGASPATIHVTLQADSRGAVLQWILHRKPGQ